MAIGALERLGIGPHTETAKNNAISTPLFRAQNKTEVVANLRRYSLFPRISGLSSWVETFTKKDQPIWQSITDKHGLLRHQRQETYLAGISIPTDEEEPDAPIEDRSLSFNLEIQRIERPFSRKSVRSRLTIYDLSVEELIKKVESGLEVEHSILICL